MSTKILLPFLTPLLSLLAIPTAAEDVLRTFDLFGDPGCGANATAETLTMDNVVDESAADYLSACHVASIGVPSWPMKNGLYNQVFLEASAAVKDGCQLVFYNPPPLDDDINKRGCFQFYRAINHNSGCANVPIGEQFQWNYCCGNGCSERLGQEKRSPPPRDVTKVKRAAPMAREFKPLDEICIFTPSSDEVITTYGPQYKCRQELDCPADSDLGCTLNGEVSSGFTIGTTTTQSVSEGISAAFEGLGASVGIEMGTSNEWSESTSFSTSFSLSVSGATKGYMTFMPKIKCKKGTFKNCDPSLDDQEQDWCVPALVKGVNTKDTAEIPDGVFNVFEFN